MERSFHLELLCVKEGRAASKTLACHPTQHAKRWLCTAATLRWGGHSGTLHVEKVNLKSYWCHKTPKKRKHNDAFKALRPTLPSWHHGSIVNLMIYGRARPAFKSRSVECWSPMKTRPPWGDAVDTRCQFSSWVIQMWCHISLHVHRFNLPSTVASEKQLHRAPEDCGYCGYSSSEACFAAAEETMFLLLTPPPLTFSSLQCGSPDEVEDVGSKQCQETD